MTPWTRLNPTEPRIYHGLEIRTYKRDVEPAYRADVYDDGKRIYSTVDISHAWAIARARQWIDEQALTRERRNPTPIVRH